MTFPRTKETTIKRHGVKKKTKIEDASQLCDAVAVADDDDDADDVAVGHGVDDVLAEDGGTAGGVCAADDTDEDAADDAVEDDAVEV